MRNFMMKQRSIIALNIKKGMGKTFPGKGGGRRLAAALGVAPSTVSHWMNGKAVPSLSSLHAMSELFGIPLRRLCGLPGEHGSGSGDIVLDIIELIVACKTKNGKRMNAVPSGAREREGIMLACRELRSLLDGSKSNGRRVRPAGSELNCD